MCVSCLTVTVRDIVKLLTIICYSVCHIVCAVYCIAFSPSNILGGPVWAL